MPKRKKTTGADSKQSRSPHLQPQSAGSALARTHESTHGLHDITGITYTELSNRHEAIKAKDAAIQAKKVATELDETKEHEAMADEVSAKLFGSHNDSKRYLIALHFRNIPGLQICILMCRRFAQCPVSLST